MKVLVPVKRVVDYNVKVRVKSDGTGVDIANVAQHPGDAVLHHFRQAASVGADHRRAGCEGLERADSERLRVCRQEEQVCRRQERRHLLDLAQEEHAGLNAQLARFLLRQLTIGPIALSSQ